MTNPTIEHTPGLWDALETEWGAKVVDCQGVTVADIPQQPTDTWRAIDNARLIGAAPEMYACLKNLYDRYAHFDASDAWDEVEDVLGRMERW